MRPPVLDVTFDLQMLDTAATKNDEGGDEPYLWNLGFKVDAETLGSPYSGSAVPSLKVSVFEAPGWTGGGQPARAPVPENHAAIDTHVGTRAVRLKPALLPSAEWFPGLAGIISVLWDQGGFTPSTAQAAFTKLKHVLEPALTEEFNRLAADADMEHPANDAGGTGARKASAADVLHCRLTRLHERTRHEKARAVLKHRVEAAVLGPVTAALHDIASREQVADRDDLLGIDAQMFTGEELLGSRPLTLTFTEDAANYTARGIVTGTRAYRTTLDATVVRSERTLDEDIGRWRRVGWGPLKLYGATAYRVSATTRFDVRPIVGPPPTFVRWFIDDRPIPAGTSTMSVTFEAADQHFVGAAAELAADYEGGAGTLTCHADGSRLEVTCDSADGVHFGSVRAVYGYADDPSLLAVGPQTEIDPLDAGYTDTAPLDVVAIEIEMDDEYIADITACMRRATEVDRTFTPKTWPVAKTEPGDRPNWRGVLAERQRFARWITRNPGVDLPVNDVLAASARRQLTAR